MKSKGVLQQQKDLLAAIHKKKKYKTTNKNGVLNLIGKSSSADLEKFFSGTFCLLDHFVRNADITHPDISNVLPSDFFGKTALYEDIKQLIVLMNICKEKSIPFTYIDKSSLRNKGQYIKINGKSLDVFGFKPSDLFIRFDKLADSRNKKRKCKLHQSVVFSATNEMWETVACDLYSLRRFENPYNEELAYAVSCKERMISHGLKACAKEIDKTISDIENRMLKDPYYGFNRIDLTQAAMRLAKIMKYDVFIEHGLNMLHLTHKAFGDYPILSAFGKSEVLFSSVEYSPRVYPYHMVEEAATEEIKDLIQYLEAFPDIGNKPLFDHYRVVLPGFRLPDVSKFRILKADGSTFTTYDKLEANIELDIALLKKHLFKGVLLGERDGQHYFICYWL